MENSKNDVLPLDYDGHVIAIRGEMLCLTDMWRAARSAHVNSGKDISEFGNRDPRQWRRKEGEPFIESVALSLNVPYGHIIETSRGRDGKTFAHWQIGLAYAKYLSPEFHMWCNTVVRDRMDEMAGKPKIVPTVAAIGASVSAQIVGGIVKKSRQATVAELANTVQSETDRTVGAILKGVERILNANRHMWKEIKKIQTELTLVKLTVDKLERAEENIEKRVKARLNAKTAAQIWNMARLPICPGGAAWLADELDKGDATLTRNASGVANRFDVEKSQEMLRKGLRAKAEKFISTRGGSVVSIVRSANSSISDKSL